MSMALSAVIGYLIGSLPTANSLARLAGVDLRSAGSKNPGANNARRLGGYRLAAVVLAVEVGKGTLAVVIGSSLAGDQGMAAGGIAAVVGNVFNVWYRLRGGKGLGITLGVLIAAWPVVVLPALVLIGAVVYFTKSTGIAALTTMTALVVALLLVSEPALNSPWGVADAGILLWLVGGMSIVLVPKHLLDAISSRRVPA